MLKNRLISLIRPGAQCAHLAGYRSRPSTASRALTCGVSLSAALLLTMTAPVAGLRPASAAPYASNVTITGTTVTFVLNQQADLVEYSINGGAPTALDGSAAGTLTFTLGAATDTFKIRVKDNDAIGYTVPTGATTAVTTNSLSQPTSTAGLNLLSTDTNVLNRFNSPRGVTVVTAPNAPNFGNAYISNSNAGTLAAVGALPARAVGDGIYALKPDQSDAYGYGNTATYGTLPITTDATTGTGSPFRVTAAANGEIYVADFSDATGLVGRLSPNLTTSALVLADVGGPTTLPVGRNHGSVPSAIPILGAGDALTLYTLDEDLPTKNSVWRYDIPTTATPFAGQPTRIASPLTVTGQIDLDTGADGKLYVTQNRSAGGEAGLFVYAPNGTQLYNSLTASRALFGNPTPAAADILTNVYSVAVSPKQDLIALILANNNIVVIPLVNGIPDLARRLIVDTGNAVALGRDIAFDAAGNIHYVSSGQGLYRVIGPGGNTDINTVWNGTELSLAPTASVTSINRASTSPNQGNSVDFTVTFNQSVTGVDASDFAVATTGAITGAAVTNVTGSGTTYTVTVSGISGASGTIGLNLIDNDSITDGATVLGGTGATNGNFTGQVYTRKNAASAPGAIISEFRLRGPGGTADEYVEIYNTTNAPLDISGWSIRTNTGTAAAPAFQVATIPAATTIPAFGHYLFTGANYSLAAYGASDVVIGGDAANDSGIALLDTSGAVQDAVGFTGSDPGLREGAGLPLAPTTSGTTASQYAFTRAFIGQTPKDTGDNAADFIFISTNGANFPGISGSGNGGTINARLGSPNPEGFASPTNINAQIGVRVLDANFGPNVAPNRVRTGSGNGGSLLFRRIIKNNGTQPLNRIRLLVTDITGLVSPVVAGQADVRLTSQATEDVTIAGQATPVTVFGTTLEAPSIAPTGTGPTTFAGGLPTGGTVGGGGLGASVNYDVVLTTPLAPGEERAYGFNVQVARTGSFFININVLGK